MKFRQKIVLFLVIVVVDLILCGVTLRMWKGEDGEKDFKADVYHERNREESPSITSLEKSVESHYCALAAEESRLHGGAVIELDDIRQKGSM